MGVLGNKTEYTAYYGDFRGVDFSSDHTQVDKSRLAYAVNMYKDYQSGQGQALETIPGFRRRVELPDAPTVYGIHSINIDNGGEKETIVLIHAGKKLYHWHNYPLSLNVAHSMGITLPEPSGNEGGLNKFEIKLEDEVYAVKGIALANGDDVISYEYDFEKKMLTISSSDLQKGDTVYLSYVEGVIGDALPVVLNERRSASFVFNNRLYIVDGKNYFYYDKDGVHDVLKEAYIPTTYINIIPAGENADAGKEYEQRNILQPKFKHTFVADGETTEFYLNEKNIEEISEVKLYGKVVTNYTADLNEGKITFKEAPAKPGSEGYEKYPEFYAGVEITAKKFITSVSGVTGERENIYELITECTLSAIFDNRVFFSGNPAYPNHVFYCGRNITGYVDPSYFGVYNYMQDGVGLTPITGLVPVADTLAVLKGDTQQDGSVFFHTVQHTGEDLAPVVYPSTQGLSGIGCLGASVNFLDDPIFVSRLGVEGIGQYTSAKYERGIEHRSSLIDAKLVNLNLKNAIVTEWNGYLVLLVDGEMFLADSRQRYTHAIGTMQYEWYYISGVGTYDGQYTEYKFSETLPGELEGVTVKYEKVNEEGNTEVYNIPIKIANAVYNRDLNDYENLCAETVNGTERLHFETEKESNITKVHSEIVEFDFDGIKYYTLVNYAIHELYDANTGEALGYEAFVCETKENKIGGRFIPAVMIKNLDENLFFGTEGGIVCSFNFDKRDEDGFIAPRYYNFDERTIVCGCATKMDNCSFPHLTKSTVKKSTVVKTKSMQTSAAKVRVRTNKKPYDQIARINSAMFSFDSMDFSDFSFATSEQSLFAINEKEKKWVEKQYYVYSDEYMKPFSIFYLCYRYTVAGRYKE